MTDRVELLEDDHVYARRVIAAFFGDAFSASYTTVNHDVIEVLGHMIAESSDCSEWIELVPSPIAPVGARPGLKWSLRQVRKVGRGLMASAKKHNFMCLTSVGRNFRTRLEEAKMGLGGF